MALRDSNPILISPSLLAADFSHLADEVGRIEADGADWLHLDVMDGQFVPNISFGAPVIGALRRHTGLSFDVHLMIRNPGRYVADFAKAGADIISFHRECADDPSEVIAAIRAAGIPAAMAISPKTPVSAVLPYLDQLRMVLVMTVEPGFGGQSLIPETLDKVCELRREIDARGLDILVEVDGGLNGQNTKNAVAAGANVIVAGSAIFKAQDPAEVIRQMRG